MKRLKLCENHVGWETGRQRGKCIIVMVVVEGGEGPTGEHGGERMGKEVKVVNDSCLMVMVVNQ